MAKFARRNGSTSNILRVKVLNSSSTVGAGLTGLTFSSTGMKISTIASTEATATAYTVAGSTIETVTTLGTFAAPTATKCRFKEVDATNHPGLYEIQIADARFAIAAARSLIVSLSGATNMAPVDLEVDLQLEVGAGGINRAAFSADSGLQSLRSATAQAGAASTITLDAGASSVNDFYDGAVLLTGGTGAGQFRDITGYVGSTKVATVSAAWATIPDATTTFALFPGAATALELADVIWDEALAGHVAAGTAGAAMGTAGGGATPADVATALTTALTAVIPDSVPADGTRPSIQQALYILTQFMMERSVSGTTMTVKKPDGSTSLLTLTLNSATAPTSVTRAT